MAWRPGAKTLGYGAEAPLRAATIDYSLGLKDYGITEGCKANFVLVRGRNPPEAIVSHNKDRMVFRDGKMIRKSTPLSI